MDPITGRRAGQMSGQETAGPGSPDSPERAGRPPLRSASLPFWAAGSGAGEHREAPAGFGRPELGGSSSGDEGPDLPSRPWRAASPERGGGWERAGALMEGNGGPVPDLPAGHHPFRHGEITHLARDSRLPAWRRRLIIAIGAGVLFTVFTNWRIGLTVAVLAAIVDAFISSRASAASNAEGLVSGAQRRTKKELAKLERSGYRALHVRAIPETDQVIDHLLVGPTGIYAIDSEQWDRRLPVRTRNGRQLWHGPYSQKQRLEHAHWEAAQASDLIGHALGEEVTVRPAMAVYGPSVPWGFATIRDVDVFSGDKLRRYLRRHRAGADARLVPAEVERIYAVADKILPPKR